MTRSGLMLSVASALLLSACGGSSNNSSPPPPTQPVNQAPSASASSDQSVVSEGGSVTLNASASSDPDGDALTYSWEQTAGTTAQIATPDAAETVVDFGDVDLDETATFRVTVSDGSLNDTADIDVTLQNLSDSPDENGVLNIRTQGTPVAITQNIRSDGTGEFIYVERDEAGETRTVYYEIETGGDGSIVGGVPLRKTGGFQDFDPDVTFARGYGDNGVRSGYEANFFAIEPDRVLLLRDPAFDGTTGDVNNDPSKIYEVGVELPGDNACLTLPGLFQNPFGRLVETGYSLIGYEGGGLSLFGWPFDQPDMPSETIIDQTQSYCGHVNGRPVGQASVGLSTPVAFLDVAARIVDVYNIGVAFQNRFDAAVSPAPGIGLAQSFDLSALGIDPAAQPVFSKSFGFLSVHAYGDGQAGSPHQILLLYVSRFGPPGPGDFELGTLDVLKTRVIEIEGGPPTDMEFVENNPGSFFHDASVPATQFIVLTQPDTSTLAKIPIISSPGFFVFPAEYQDIGSGAQHLSSFLSGNGADPLMLVTYPDDNRISVYPVQPPAAP